MRSAGGNMTHNVINGKMGNYRFDRRQWGGRRPDPQPTRAANDKGSGRVAMNGDVGATRPRADPTADSEILQISPTVPHSIHQYG
jgi:hypothetical protein